MDIKVLVSDLLEENTYILSINKECIIIDPACNYDLIKEEVKDKKILGILITHYHFDHIRNLKKLISKYNVKVIDYKKEGNIKLNNFNFEIIKTKGHTSDSVSYYFKNDKVMFTGDFIFKESIGRCDLPTGNTYEMNESLKLLKKYSDDIVLYPGHGENTMLSYEKKNNYYLKGI